MAVVMVGFVFVWAGVAVQLRRQRLRRGVEARPGRDEAKEAHGPEEGEEGSGSERQPLGLVGVVLDVVAEDHVGKVEPETEQYGGLPQWLQPGPLWRVESMGVVTWNVAYVCSH